MDVAAAVIRHDGKVFVARRGPGKHMAGYWEFPGGKLEAGESVADCLARELAEEFTIAVEVGEYLGESLHDYGDRVVRLIAHEVYWVGGEFRPAEHDAMQWLAPGKLSTLRLAPADIPLLRYIR